MSKKPVIVYGASGYTGRLVCEYLRELGIPFIAAGRDKKRVQEVMDKVPGIETADYEVVEVEHDVKALTKLFKGAKPGPLATLPPGPNSPVGVMWMGLSKPHYGIHGTPEPGSISKTQSNGCIRMTNWSVLQVSEAVSRGTPVTLIP